MRDQIVGEAAHFERRIELVDEFKHELLKLVGDSDRYSDYGSMPGARIHELRRLSALYSLGASIDDIRDAFTDLPDWFSRELSISPTVIDDPAIGGSAYNDFLWVTALTVLFDDKAGAQRLGDAIEHFGLTDFLLDSFVGSLIDFREPSQSLQLEIISNHHGLDPINRSHEPLKAAAELAATDPDEASAALAQFVQKDWYRLHRWAGWHNQHNKRRGSENFCGYWCYEGAAVAKVFNIDDSTLEGHKYYPWDLAHPPDS